MANYGYGIDCRKRLYLTAFFNIDTSYTGTLKLVASTTDDSKFQDVATLAIGTGYKNCRLSGLFTVPAGWTGSLKIKVLGNFGSTAGANGKVVTIRGAVVTDTASTSIPKFYSTPNLTHYDKLINLPFDGIKGTYIPGFQSFTRNRNVAYLLAGHLNTSDGLTSGSGAFKTIQAAVNSILKRIDAQVTISVADGTYPEDVQIFGFVGSAFIYLIGNTTTPTNCIVNSVTVAYCSVPIEIKGFDAIVANNYGFSAYASTHVSIGNCRSVTVKVYGGAVFSATKGYIFDCVFSNGLYGVASIVGAAIYIRGISGTGNTHGLYASTGGIIGIKDNVTISGTNAKVTEGGLIVPFELGSGVIQTPFGTSLPATTGTVAVTMDSKTKALTPTGNCTFNADTSGTTGDECTFFITTSGTTSYTMTFGTNFKSVGTLATGTVTAKVFTITFKKLGSVWYETSRTAAM